MTQMTPLRRVSPGTAAPRSTPHAEDRTIPCGPLLDPRMAPIRVVELDIGDPPAIRMPGSPARTPVADLSGPVHAVVRLHGRPLGTVQARIADPATALDVLLEAAGADLGTAIDQHLAEDRPKSGAHPDSPQCLRRRALALADPPSVSVVIATRERPADLARCLESVVRLRYPRFEVVVVDNAPDTDAAERIVRERFASRVTYVREPRPGLAVARNRGLAHAHGQIIAFTDDDVIVDADWLAAIAEGFMAGEDVGCVTGLTVPAELETPAQVAFERQGGFDKGFEQRYHRLQPKRRARTDSAAASNEPAVKTAEDPMFPFTAGRFGTGANMAWSAAVLRKLGGFDTATGAGSLARGGEDLLAFFRTIVAGHALFYQPGSIVWHHHRRTREDLERQTHGYRVGLGAYLTAALVHEPQMIPAFLRCAPRGLAHAVEVCRSRNLAENDDWAPRRTAAQLGALLYGPLAYARSSRRSRRTQ